MDKITRHSSANSFGSGKCLIGKECRGQKIIEATRKYIVLENGKTILRKGSYVKHEVDPDIIIDNCYYQTDDL